MSAAVVEELTLVDDDGMCLSLSASWLGRTSEIPKLVFAIGEGPHPSVSISLAPIAASEILSWLTDDSAASSLTLQSAIGDRLELFRASDGPPNATVVFRITTWTDITREFHGSIPLAIDLAKFGAMLVNPSSPPPAFIVRVRKVNALLGFEGSVEDCVTEVTDMPDDEIAKLLMGLAAGDRVDLAVSLLASAIVDAGHNPALIAKLGELEAQEKRLKAEIEAIDDAIAPEPAEIASEVEATIQSVRDQIESLLSNPVGPNSAAFREVVRGMIERITIVRHESGAIEVTVRGQFAGVMQAAGLVERYALKQRKAPEAGASGASLSVVAGAGFEPAAFRL